MPRIRPATPDDSRVIASFLQRLLGSLRSYTIVGCTGLQNHIADSIRANRSPNSTYLLCTDGGATYGVSEWRTYDSRLHLNHVFVIPEHRAKGVGSMLLRKGLQYFDPSSHDLFSVDSFENNQRASDWYASLGLTPTFARSWRVAPIAAATKCPDDVHLHGIEEANRQHGRYGFSQFTVEVHGKNYEIGRLGEQYFRTTSSAFLKNPKGVSALGHLDPSRKLLRIIDDNVEPAPGETEVATSIRHETTCGRLRTRLAATLQEVSS